MSNASDVSNLAALAAAREKDAEDIAVADWPKPLAAEAFHGVVGKVVRAIEPHTESDPVAILVQLLVGLGSLVGREPYFPVEADRHGTNLFLGLVAPTGKGRKGTSYGHVRNICTKIDEDWTVLSGLSSGEGLTYAVRDEILKMKPGGKGDSDAVELQTIVVDEGVSDKRLLVMESEFANSLRVMAREGNTLSGIIRIAWDTGNLRFMTKVNAVSATDAHISIIGHITKSELLRYFSATDASNGFGNRFLWIAARRSKRLPLGGALKDSELKPLVEQLKKACEFASQAGRLARTPLADKVWVAIYAELSESKPGLFGSMITRAEAQVMRLAAIYALLDCSKAIRSDHLLAALAVWDYAEESTRYIFGDSMGDPVAEEILKAVQAAPLGLTKTEIRDLFGRNKSAKELGGALGRLLDLGLLRREREPTGGRPVERWVSSGGGYAKNDQNDQRSDEVEFGRLGRLSRSYLTMARGELERLRAAGEVEGKPVPEEIATAFDGSNGASTEESDLPF